MPIRIDADLPAKKILERENIFVMDYERSMKQDIRPLKILILNVIQRNNFTKKIMSNLPKWL